MCRTSAQGLRIRPRAAHVAKRKFREQGERHRETESTLSIKGKHTEQKMPRRSPNSRSNAKHGSASVAPGDGSGADVKMASSSTASARKPGPKPSKGKKSKRPISAFIQKLYAIVDGGGGEDLAKWHGDGSEFMIRNPAKFSEQSEFPESDPG